MAKVVAIKIATQKGVSPKPVESGECIENFGLKGDAHAGNGKRQISLLAQESIDKMAELGTEGLCTKKFVENITTRGIKLHLLEVGTRLKISNAEFEISQTGKECYKNCAILDHADLCALAIECAFAKVIKGGSIKNGDKIEILGTKSIEYPLNYE